MDLSERHKRTSSFFTMCQSVLSKKGAQYVTQGEDAYATFVRLANCAEVSTTTGMAVLLAKQVQGLVIALKQGDDAGAMHRCLDVANSAALIAVYVGDTEIPEAATEH